ncbi:MAG: NAD(P)H-hydrate dehydratase, partial [Oscillospiraceae bacterium]|nr:NAD(P)H-hydrate dehydratase [Oscillospiraceae bacterium]
VTPEQMKYLEAEADRNGNTYEMLMEKAGEHLAEKIISIINLEKNEDNNQDFDIIFLCGNGNNAGDCFVAARYLKQYGIDSVAALLCGEPKTEIAKLNFSRIDNIEVMYEFNKCIDKLSDSKRNRIIVDGVFGTGFHGELPEEVREVFSACRESDIVIAVDVPSGGDCRNGQVSDGTLKADHTVTFGFIKFGMTQYPLKEYCGEICVADIGIPEEYADNFKYKIKVMCDSKLKNIIPRKKPDSHKGNYGRLLIVCGSEKMPGACIMAAEASARSGVGLLQIATVKSITPVITNRLPEAMLEPLEADENGYISSDNFEKIMSAAEKASAVLIGCGLGVTNGTIELVKNLLKNLNCPIILDADGINCISDSIDIIRQTKSSIILTPHPAEMGRLCGRNTAEIQSDRLGTAMNFSNEYNATVVLKGAGTVIAEKNNIYVNQTGNPGMGKGGSGDVLSGIIASFAAQGISTVDSAVLGTFVHGAAGDLAASKKSMQSMIATDIIGELGEVLKKLT